MARRATVDRSPQPLAHEADDGAAPEMSGSSPGTWRGAGGRWLVWAFRGVVWAVLLVVGYRGVMAIVVGQTSSGRSAAPAAAPAATGFPVTLAKAYALQFGSVYLNASQANAARRARELAAFAPPGSAAQFGWSQSGSLRLDSEQVAGVRVKDARHAVVTLLARVNGQLMELGVPVYAARGGLSVSSEPSWLPAPARVAPPAPPAISSDAAARAILQRQLPAFFRAYASGNRLTLDRFLAPGAAVRGLNSTVAFGALSALDVPTGGATRHITATVRWQIPPAGTSARAPASASARAGAGTKAAGAGVNKVASLEMTYALTVVNRGGTWYVKDITAPARGTASP